MDREPPEGSEGGLRDSSDSSEDMASSAYGSGHYWGRGVK